MVSSAPGLRDVAYFLGSSVPTDLRRARERKLIARYCERLREGGNRAAHLRCSGTWACLGKVKLYS